MGLASSFYRDIHPVSCICLHNNMLYFNYGFGVDIEIDHKVSKVFYQLVSHTIYQNNELLKYPTSTIESFSRANSIFFILTKPIINRITILFTHQFSMEFIFFFEIIFDFIVFYYVFYMHLTETILVTTI